jgi:hypothetical protein
MRDTKLGRLAVSLAAAGALGLGVSAGVSLASVDSMLLPGGGALISQVTAALEEPPAAVQDDYIWN